MFNTNTLNFDCGNPCVDHCKGILVYETESPGSTVVDTPRKNEDVIIVFVNVPLSYTIGRFWNSLCALHTTDSSTVRLKILRNLDDEDSYACMTVCSIQMAQACINDHQGTRYSALEDKEVVLGTVIDIQPEELQQKLLKNLYSPSEGVNCAVCLDSLILTDQHKVKHAAIVHILCGHQFHMECLQQTISKDCPVCRYPQRPEKPNRCAVCSRSAGLKLCLLCGFVGCVGEALQDEPRLPEAAGHAGEHYKKTGHLFALELDTQKVFDYVCNSYVHRVLHDESGQKLISMDKGVLPYPSSKHFGSEMRQLHVTMNEQIVKQSEHFSEVKKTILLFHQQEVQRLRRRVEELQSEVQELDEANTRDTEAIEKVDETIARRAQEYALAEATLADMKQRLQEARSAASTRKKNEEEEVKKLERQYSELQLENGKLRSQLRDVEFHLSSRKKTGKGSLVIL